MNLIHSRYNIIGALESLPGGREENQDFMGFADTQLGFVLVLCDGMGGGPGGLLASSTVVETVINHLSTYTKEDDVKTAIRKSITLADEQIAKIITQSPALTGMGTTIVVLVINKNSAYVAHIGDSRLYQFRFGWKVFRTADHSQVGELVRCGELTEEQARISPNSNVVTRAINGCGNAQPEITELPYESGDRFVLCSDGIWGSMPEEELIKGFTKTKSVSGTVVQMAFDVEEIGKSAGGKHDNLSIAIIETHTNSKLKVKMGKKIRNVLFSLLALLVVCLIANVWIMSSFCSYKKNNPLKEVIDTLCKDTAKLNTEIKSQHSKINYFEKQISDYKNKNDSLREDNYSLKIDKDNLKSELEKEKSKKIDSEKVHEQAKKTNTNVSLKQQGVSIDNVITSINKLLNQLPEPLDGKFIKDSDIESVISILNSIVKTESSNDRKEKINTTINDLNEAKNNANPKGAKTQKEQLNKAFNKIKSLK